MKVSKVTVAAGLAGLLVLATGGNAWASPAISSVSGTISPGGTVTIYGSGFGTKSQAAPRIWDDFESGTNGDSIDGKAPVVGPNWDTYTSHGTLPKYCNVGNRANSSLCSKHDFVVASQYNCSLEYYEVTDTAYFTFWWKYSKQQAFFNRNTKPWIEYGQTGGYYPLAYNGFGNPDYGDGALRDSIQDSPSPSGPTKWGSPNLSNIVDEWIRFEVWAVQSTPNVSDGTLRTWVHRPQGSSPSIVLSLDNSNRMTRTSSHQWKQWHFGSYHARDVDPYGGGGPASAYIYTDDVYFDVTLARVELGNAATWNACTHREIQVPSAWSSGMITAAANRGSFPDGTTAYLYVVDGTGAVNSSGYPVTVTGVTYALTVNSGSGDGDYPWGTVVDIDADSAPSSKVFDKWIGDTAGIANVNNASTTLTMPAADQEITATYTDVLYTLTVNSGSGDGAYAAGQVVAILADAAPGGKKFWLWTGDTSGIADVEAASTTLTMPAGSTAVTATYTYLGDLNGDGFVGQTDLDIVLDDWGLPVPPADPRADPSGDDFVGQTDLDHVLQDWGKSALP